MSAGGGGAQAAHSLAFRVMRLCRPTFHVETSTLKFDPCDLFFGEDLFDDPIAASNLPRLLTSINVGGQSNDSAMDPLDLSYRSRFLLNHPSDSIGLPGLLVLPQSFGAIYLGETFCSYISINNSSNIEVRDVIIKKIFFDDASKPSDEAKSYLERVPNMYLSFDGEGQSAEIQTEKQRILLLDTSKSPVESIRASGRYDFIVEHDVKELGAHTLVCTALYSDGDGERKYLPQFFKFMVSNPLSVRTKVRVVKENTFLEACIENNTKSNLYMDQVEFEPAHNWTAKVLKADGHLPEHNLLTREVFKEPILIRAGGGIYNYLYQLRFSSQESARVKLEGSNVLGKLQITWRTNLGEPGRLQTQNILGNPITRKEIELQSVEVPSIIILETPFVARLNLINQTDRVLGPFELWLSESNTLDEKTVMVNGLQTMTLGEVQACSSLEFQLNLIAVKNGIQKISGITVLDTIEKKTYDSLLELEIYVDSE